MPLQLSNISMPYFVFQLTNQLSKLYYQSFWCGICSSPSQRQPGHGGGYFQVPLSLPHQSILSSPAQPPGWAPWTHPPGPQEVWQKHPQLLQLIYEAAILHMPLCSPCDAVVISTKTEDFCSSHLLYMVEVICEESSNGEGKITGARKEWRLFRLLGTIVSTAAHLQHPTVWRSDCRSHSHCRSSPWRSLFFLSAEMDRRGDAYWPRNSNVRDGTRICRFCSVRQENL